MPAPGIVLSKAFIFSACSHFWEQIIQATAPAGKGKAVSKGKSKDKGKADGLDTWTCSQLKTAIRELGGIPPDPPGRSARADDRGYRSELRRKLRRVRQLAAEEEEKKAAEEERQRQLQRQNQLCLFCENLGRQRHLAESQIAAFTIGAQHILASGCSVEQAVLASFSGCNLLPPESTAASSCTPHIEPACPAQEQSSSCFDTCQPI